MAKSGLRVILLSLVATAIVAACSGGANGPSGTPVNPMAAGSGFVPSAPSNNALHTAERRRQRIALDEIGKALTLPSIAGMTERMTLPANDAPPGATLAVTVSNALPPSVSRLPATKSEIFLSFTLAASADVTLRGIPKFSVRLRSKPANDGAFYAWAFSPQSGWRDFGPMTVSGNVLTFGGRQKNVKLQRGVAYAVIPFTAAPSQGCPTGAVLFVTNFRNSTVTEYTSPYTGAPTATISNSVNTPYGLAFNASGNLFVANYPSNNVTRYASPFTGAPTATISSTVSGPTGAAFNASGNLFVTNYSGDNVTEYAPPYTGAPIAIISNGLNFPFGVAFNASGNLFVTNFGNNTVTEYAPPYTGAPIATISSSVSGPTGVAFNASGNLFVANGSSNTVTEYAPPYTGAPIASNSNGLIEPFGVAFNASGNLFVANFSGDTVTEYAPPYTGAPIATITNSLDLPTGVTFGP